MASIRVTEDIHDLADDMAGIVRRASKDMRATVRQGAIVGNSVARDNAKRTAGKHGKHYPKAFTWEMRGTVAFGGVSGYSAEYGPDIARPQGGMSFEYGSRNQRPHLDLAKSADVIGPSFAGEVSRLPSGWFW